MDFVEAAEALFFFFEVELNVAGRAVTVFFDEDFGDVLFVGLGIVILFAVNKGDDVGVLLDGTGLAKVG